MVIALASDDPRENPRLTRLETEVQEIRRWAFGNGTRGADERLRRIEDTMEGVGSLMDKMEAQLARLNSRQDARDSKEQSDRKARRYFAFGVIGTLIALAIAGVQFIVWLTEKVELILRAVGTMPPGPF